jgi:hypothetical protein
MRQEDVNETKARRHADAARNLTVRWLVSAGGT